MKKLFSFGVALFLLTGIWSTTSATIIKSAGVPGTPVTGADWALGTTWSGGVVPTITDSVQIIAGDSVGISTEIGCAYLQVDGTALVSNKLHVNGDISVAGTLNTKSTGIYCYNLYNTGRFWASTATGSSSSTRSVYLGCGFTLSGTTYTITYPSGADYVLVNDGRFGDFPTRAVANSVSGSGISLFFNTNASSLTIRPSSSSVTPVAFGIAQILPVPSLNNSNNFILNIAESMSLVKYSSSAAFSLQNGDAFTGSRTCNITAGTVLSIAGYLHTRNTTPAANQATMTYNIDGTLDLASVATSNTTNEAQFYTSATSPNIVVKVNATGSLIFGKAVKLSGTASGQSVAINVTSGGLVKFGVPTGLTIATPVTLTNLSFPISLDNITNNNTNGIAFTMSGTLPQTIYGAGKTISALTISSTGGVSLASPLVVTNALSLSGSNLLLGNNDLTLGSVANSSATSYIVTNGTGKLNLTAKTTGGTLFPIGTATNYAPVTVTPTADVAVSASVSGTTTGTFAGYGVNANEWTLTPQTATTATLAFTPATATYTTSPAILFGSGYASKADATLTSGVYSASSIAIPAAATIFATGGTTTPTGVNLSNTNALAVYGSNHMLMLKNATIGDQLSVFNANGAKVATSVLKSDNFSISLQPGMYLVKVGAKTSKVVIL